MNRNKRNEENLITVILPIYNVEKYLRRAVDSIRKQTYKNLEIILVDDGSSDGCKDICDELALEDKRIKTIHKKMVVFQTLEIVDLQMLRETILHLLILMIGFIHVCMNI